MNLPSERHLLARQFRRPTLEIEGSIAWVGNKMGGRCVWAVQPWDGLLMESVLKINLFVSRPRQPNARSCRVNGFGQFAFAQIPVKGRRARKRITQSR